MITQTQPKTGGGCRPKGINVQQARSPLPLFLSDPEAWEKQQAEERAKREREHAAFLLTPAGQEWLATQERIRLAEEARKAELERARQASDAFNAKFNELRQPPAIGTIIKPQHEYSIWVCDNDKLPGKFSGYVLLRVEGEHPKDALPYRVLGNHGRHGLKVFLDERSMDLLEQQNIQLFDRLRLEIAEYKDAIKRRREQLQNLDLDAIYDSTGGYRQDPEAPCHVVNGSSAIKIIGLAASKKSARGTFVK